MNQISETADPIALLNDKKQEKETRLNVHGAKKKPAQECILCTFIT